MWVWQSQASAGISKFTLVAGCDALAKTGVARIAAPVAMAPTTMVRRVGIV